MDDRREHVRDQVSIKACLLLRDEKPKIITCRIIDISEGGAKVELAVIHPLPPQVFLVKDEDEIIYECEPAWQNGQLGGLMFLDLCAGAKRQELLEDLLIAETVARRSEWS